MERRILYFHSTAHSTVPHMPQLQHLPFPKDYPEIILEFFVPQYRILMTNYEVGMITIHLKMIEQIE